ncbi:CidA/LrgA family protein [Vibrio sp. STUT-A11]|uniref:CidA/LrgA family protein n=1 Tax=Vibrio sp. STUT-A11 TaxID=2976236 RepID=UPI002232A1AE|nr:CidA/LrgA family protein [Vibrio sp. STUT-A11]BDR15869.1 CidA/LrgA family protein [Vibrio sp. STUT-A11]
MVRCFLTVLQIVGLSLIWLAGDYLVRQFHLPIPANVTGMLLLLLLLLARVVNVNWLRDGATWLLAEMLLFFVPAVVAVVNYQSLVVHQGLKIFAVLLSSTIIVIAATALVIDRVYRFELKLARRKRSCNQSLLAKDMES